MAILKVDTVSGIGTEGPVFEGDIEFTSQNSLTLPKGDTAQRGRGRGMIMGGFHPAVQTMEFVSIQSQGNSIAFGDMDSTRGLAAAANTTRGLFAGGKGPDVQNLERIFFITMASTGNATDFGNLTQGRRKPEGVTNSTRACFGGGNLEPSGRLNRIDFVTISSAGNAADFGDLSLPREVGNSNSDSHGGLGGF